MMGQEGVTGAGRGSQDIAETSGGLPRSVRDATIILQCQKEKCAAQIDG